MKAKIIIEVTHCIQCPYHEIQSDPDPDDWFNDDDEKIMCKFNGLRRIAGACRPYETKTILVPNWCPHIVYP